MPVFKYRDPQTGEWINVAGGGGGAANIPIQDEPPASGDLWVDTSEEGTSGGNGEVSFDGVANEYVWEKTQTLGEVVFGEQVTVSASNNNQNYSFNYSDGYTINEDTGEISLAAPISATSMSQGASKGVVGKYIQSTSFGDNKVLICDSCYWADYGAGSLQYRPVSYVKTTTSYGYVNSSDSNAYPIEDGFAYTALGQLGGAFGGAKIATGSYTGTGTFGESSPNSLMFDFVPKVVFIQSLNKNIAADMLILTAGSTIVYPITHARSTNSEVNFVNWTGNSVSWWTSNDAVWQMNHNTTEYNYIAIG